MSARTGLRPSLDSGFVPGLRLPSIRQKRRPSTTEGDKSFRLAEATSGKGVVPLG